MTIQEILHLPKGKELNAAVALRVMGWQQQEDPSLWLKPKGAIRVVDPESTLGIALSGFYPSAILGFYPSAILMDAWQIVEFFTAQGWRVKLGNRFFDQEPPTWWCEVWENEELTQYGEGSGETAPMAICRAALETMATLCPNSFPDS